MGTQYRDPLNTQWDFLGTTATIKLPTENDMPYAAFEICTVPIGGEPKRGARAKCGYEQCGRTESIHIAPNKSHGDDDAQVERSVVQKFEKLGWKIGKTPSQHRCPSCYTALKVAAKKRNTNGGGHVEKIIPTEPVEVVVLETQTPPVRRPSRDERRIIHKTIDEHYVSETVGYSAGWNDKKVAEDLGVPQEWVAELREADFGPDIDETVGQTMTEAKTLLQEIQAALYPATEIHKSLLDLGERATRIEKLLTTIAERK